MKPSAIKSIFIFTILLILGSSVYLGLTATAFDPRIEREPSITEPSYPAIERSLIPSRRSAITLEEARARAKFEFPVPTYLPQGISLTRVEVDEILPIDRFYLYFSDSPANVTKLSLEIDYSFERPPSDEELERMASRYIRVSPDWIIEGLIENTYTVSIEDNYKIIRENLHKVVSFKGTKGIGRELGYTNELQGSLPAYLLWWKDGLRFEMESFACPLNELVKIAESMVVQRSSDKTVKKIAPTTDANVTQGYPDNNRGDTTALYLQRDTEGYKNERIFLKFNLDEIPAGSRIKQARIHLYCWRGKDSSMNAQALGVKDDTWDEATITWNNQPSTGEVLDAILLDSLAAENRWHSWDVTSFVETEYKGDKVVSLALKAAMEDASGQYAFESKEWFDTTLHPYLEVVYTPPPYAMSAFISRQDEDAPNLPGSLMSYLVRVTNEGGLEDTYTLGIKDTAGWASSIFPSSLTIPPSESRFALMQVGVPQNALLGMRNEVTLTVTSATDDIFSYVLTEIVGRG